MVRNTFLLRIRVWLHKLGLVKPKPVDYDAFAARMCLETSMACYYKSKVGDVAGFFFPNLPYTWTATGSRRCASFSRCT